MVCITSCKDALLTKSCFCSEQDLLWCTGVGYGLLRQADMSLFVCVPVQYYSEKGSENVTWLYDMLYWQCVQTRPQWPDSCRDFSLTRHTCFTRHPTEIPAGQKSWLDRGAWGPGLDPPALHVSGNLSVVGGHRWTLHIQQEQEPKVFRSESVCLFIIPVLPLQRGKDANKVTVPSVWPGRVDYIPGLTAHRLYQEAGTDP